MCKKLLTTQSSICETLIYFAITIQIRLLIWELSFLTDVYLSIFCSDTHPPSKPSQKTLVIKGTERVQLFHGRDQRLHRRGVHEVKGQQVIDPHGLQWEHGAGQIRALDLGNVCWQHLVSVGALSVEAVAFSGASSACPTSSLFGLCLCYVKYILTLWYLYKHCNEWKHSSQ